MSGTDEAVGLLYSADENDLRAAVREVLADRCPPAEVLARHEKGEVNNPELWSVLSGMALGGIAVPEEYQGAGAGWREAAVVLEELGRGVAPVPFLGSAVVAVAAALSCGDAELLGSLGAGETTAALALPFTTSPYGELPTVATARADGSGAVLTGTVTSVADAVAADVLLVPADDGLYAVDATAAGVTRTPVTSLDITRQVCDLRFSDAPGRRIAGGEAAQAAVRRALTVGAGLLASEQLGMAEWCVDTTVAYLKERHQFGRPLASFQALKHRLADLWVSVSEARAAARYAAGCLAEDDADIPVAVAVAQAFCSEIAVTAAEECIQLHGGIGFTWEHPAHLFLKRAKADAVAFGTADRHRTALAELVALPVA